ncbi:MAG: hypothetical protein ACLUHL_05010 [Dysosmobacter welbionis]
MKLSEDGFDLAVVNGTIIDVVRQSFAQVNLGIRDGKIAAITLSPWKRGRRRKGQVCLA